jgi:hypothetical protein
MGFFAWAGTAFAVCLSPSNSAIHEATRAYDSNVAEEDSLAVAQVLAADRARDSALQSAQRSARESLISQARLDGNGADCLGYERHSGECVLKVTEFNARVAEAVPVYQAFDLRARVGKDSLAGLRRLALASAIEIAYLDAGAASLPPLAAVPARDSGARPAGMDPRCVPLFAALEPFLFRARNESRYRVAASTDTARFTAWLTARDPSAATAPVNGPPRRGWGDYAAADLPPAIVTALDSAPVAAYMGPVAADFGAWSGCRFRAIPIRETRFAEALPFLARMLHEGPGFPRFDSAALAGYRAGHPALTQRPDTLRLRVWLVPRGGFPGSRVARGKDTMGIPGRELTQARLPPALGARLDSLWRSGGIRPGDFLDMGEWPLGRWRIRLLSVAQGKGSESAAAADARLLRAMHAPWLAAWETEKAAMEEGRRDAAWNRVRERAGYSLDSISALARRWGAADLWIDSARIFAD